MGAMARTTASPPAAATRAGSAAAVAGAAASLLAIAVVHVLVPDVPFAPVSVAERVIRLTPGGVATVAIESLGGLAEPLLVVATIAVFLLIASLLGRSLAALARALGDRTALAAFVLGLPLVALGALVGESIGAAVPSWISGLVLVGALAVGSAVTAWRYAALTGTPEARAPDEARREILRAVVVGGASFALAATGLGRTLLRRPGPEMSPLRVRTTPRPLFPAPPPPDPSLATIGGLAPRVTSAGDFYTIDTALFDPIVDEHTWQLEIGGLVDHPFRLGYDELLSLPAVTFDSTLECISNEVGGDLISNGRWIGVPMRALLERAGMRHGVVEVVSTSVDGYSDSIPIAEVMRDTSIVAFALDGRPLPTAHGFPARILVPGHYGMKQPKWLASIEPVDTVYEGYWEQRGWSKAAVVKTMSRIDAAVADGDRTVLAGVAFAGDRGISRVEVSLDGGRTWDDADVEAALSPLTWRRWRYALPTSSATGTVTVRGIDGLGEVQIQRVAAPHPGGASGYDAVTI